MAAVIYEFSIGALKAFYSIVFPDILLVYISRNAVSENKKKSAPKVSSKCPFKVLKHDHKLLMNSWPQMVGPRIINELLTLMN